MITAPVYCRAFVGRREQLDALLDRYRSAVRGEGSVVLLFGDAGMGKSRLTAELCRAVESGGGGYALGECFEYLQAPFAPLRLIPEIERAFDTARASADGDKAVIFETVARSLQALTSKQPLLLVLDDIHWADAGTLELLHYLSTRIAKMRVLIVATYRQGELSTNDTLRTTLARLERQNCVWRIALEPLGDPDIRSLLHHALEGRRSPSPAMLEAIRSSAEGNPLNAEELLKSAVDTAVLHEGRTRGLPVSLTESVLERLRPLSDDQLRILQYASAIGRKFEPELLAAITDRPVDDILPALRKAVELQLILEEIGGPRIAYVFRHALTRDTIYNQLMAAQARPLHEAAAQALEASDHAQQHIAELAYHYWQARNLPKAAEYNERAGDAAVALCAFHDAALSYERAVDALSALSLPALQVELKFADALREAGEGERARVLYEKLLAAYEAAADTENAVKTCLALRIVCYEAGDTAGVLYVAQRAVAIAAHAEDRSLYFRALVGLANVLVNTSRVREVFDLLAEAERAVDVFPADADVHYYFVSAGAHAIFDRCCETQEAFERGLALALCRQDWYRATVTLVGFATDAARIGMRESAREALERYLEIARSQKLGPHTYLNTHVRCGTTFMELGELNRAREIVEEALTFPVVESGLSTIVHATALTLGLRLADENLIARAASPDFLNAAGEVAAGHFTPLAVCAVADLLRSQGEIVQAGDLLHRCIARRWDASGDDVCVLSLRVGEYGREDDVEAARDVLASFVANAPTRYLSGELALFDAYVARRRGDRGALERHASDAEAVFSELQRPYERAQALELLDRKAEAAEIYRRTGDVRDLRRLEKQLTPVNRRGRPKTELTNREREITTLVAEGKSNLAIAEQLFIGERTVETHVSSIYAKLGVSSRAELAAMILRTAAP